jgi:hypothetical protein
MELKFAIYNLNIHINCDDEGVLVKLQKDFSWFVDNHSFDLAKPIFRLDIYKATPDYDQIKQMPASSQSLNAISYDMGDIRFNDYYGNLLSKINFKTNEAKIWSYNSDRLHEVAYLLILSRSNIKLEAANLHKIHAMAVSLNDKNLVVMMPMKGGKSTLLKEFILCSEAKIISDDCPLVDRHGHIKNFPLRLGVNFNPDERTKLRLSDEGFYQVNREVYGPKVCLSLQELKFRIASNSEYSPTILVSAVRSTYREPRVEQANVTYMFKELLRHSIVGIGLPMIMEYFFQTGLKDKIQKFCFGMSRTYAAIKLLQRAKLYVVYLSNDPQKNYETIAKLARD